MPTTAIYQQADFPAVLKWQAIAFMRTAWPAIFRGTIKFLDDPYPPEQEPVHFAITEGDSLLSYATVMQLVLEHAGQRYGVAAFGNMFTFPPYRREGYGKQVLALATDYIQQSAMDVAALFCDAKLVPFYEQMGWQLMHAATRIGSPQQFEVHPVLRMMHFVSPKGKAAAAAFAKQPLYVEWPW